MFGSQKAKKVKEPPVLSVQPSVVTAFNHHVLLLFSSL